MRWHVKYVNTLQIGGWLTVDDKFGHFWDCRALNYAGFRFRPLKQTVHIPHLYVYVTCVFLVLLYAADTWTIKKKMKEDFWLLKWGVTEICRTFDGIRKSPMTASDNNWTNKRLSSTPSDIKSWHCLGISAACRTIDYQRVSCLSLEEARCSDYDTRSMSVKATEAKLCNIFRRSFGVEFH